MAKDQDDAGLAMARMLNGEIATPELLATATGISVDEVARRAEAAASLVLGDIHDEALSEVDRLYLASAYGESDNPDVQAFLESLSRRRH